MKKFLGVFVCLCAVIALGLLLLLRGGMLGSPAVSGSPVPAASSAAPGDLRESTPPPHMTPDPTPEAAEPTPEPTPEAEPESFVLSFIGDLTLAGSPGVPLNFWQTINGDYAYPFSNVKQYFVADEYTLGNLECTFSDQYLQSIEYFNFRAPTEYANILLEGGVDFVTTANNHTDDFREAGKRDTWATLEKYGVPFGKNDESVIVTTPNGLKLGIYCQNGQLEVSTKIYWIDEEKAVAAVRALKEQEPDLIICMFHMGVELNYYPEKKTPANCEACRRCIDEGADIIYSSHPHCLQPIEQYNGGLILYSMGNFVFGGSSMPSDQDTAIVQLTVKRDSNGNVSLGDHTIIPCCVSSRPVTDPGLSSAVRGKNVSYNDLRPTPYEEGTEDYLRALSKIDGTYDGPDGKADYTNWHQQHG
ncbi:MAG: CapA family protein [Oscillospiraceae bacterium]|nr:CapA family protein [Oscillospiraceae bacterium]